MYSARAEEGGGEGYTQGGGGKGGVPRSSLCSHCPELIGMNKWLRLRGETA